MKVVMTRDEVAAVLSAYGSYNLGIPTNVVEVSEAGAVLSYEPPEQQSVPKWKQTFAGWFTRPKLVGRAR